MTLKASPQYLRKKIDQCFGSHRSSLHRKLRKISRYSKIDPAKCQALLNDIERSKAYIALREQNRPQPCYDQTLPVVEQRDTILDAIDNHPVTIICGETGSGKTTQIPKICLELGRGVRGLIGHTQPRRIAARSVAVRIASELQSDMGQHVGYKVRFTDQVQENNYIKLMTDGILLAELQQDRWLSQYDTLIIDEAHERSLNIDFLLGVIKQLLPKRPDLKVIITSATIDPERFSTYFGNAPIVYVKGRTYPVEVRYEPLIDEREGSEKDLLESVTYACENIIRTQRVNGGDILVFLPGERYIHDAIQHFGAYRKSIPQLQGIELLPLYSRLSQVQQDRIFKRKNNGANQSQRIIYTTNVAETSLTVPGIRFVIDSGIARQSRYSLKSKVQRLPIEKISQAACNQRKGRCGREAAGICIRLYSKEDFTTRPEHTQPEILRTHLASVILQMLALDLGDMADFPFIDQPDQRIVRDGYRLLFELGAVGAKNNITTLGKHMSRLPIEPRFARILLAAKEENCVTELLTITSGLSVVDPRERPIDQQQQADLLHAEFNDQQSDFNSLLNLWAFIETQRRHLSHNQFRRMCQQRFLSPPRIREWQEVRQQLQQQCKELGMTQNSSPAAADAVHRALLSGLLANVGALDEKHSYNGTRGKKFKIFPGSCLRKKSPQWIFSAEVHETTQLYARTVAKVDVDWIEQQAKHLLKYSYAETRWEKKRGQVGAKQKATLHGLVINPGKWVNYGPINPRESREIFVRDGLVEGQLASNAVFYRHNIELIDEVLMVENKARRRDILVTPERLYQFYDAIIPQGIYSLATFDRWRKEAERENPRLLFFQKQHVVEHDDSEADRHDFPDYLEIDGAAFPLSYDFKPGADTDGITMTIPVSTLNRVQESPCEWLVPGLRLEKITALIKSLPKALRRNFVPAPDVARECFEQIDADALAKRSMYAFIADTLSARNLVRVGKNDFDRTLIAAHLNMRFEVIDRQGKVIVHGRDLAQIKHSLAEYTTQHIARIVAPKFERENIDSWNFGDLPRFIEVEESTHKGAVKMLGFPALQADGQRINLRVFPSQPEAQQSMYHGLLALYQKTLKQEYHHIVQKIKGIDMLGLIYAPFADQATLRQDLAEAAFSTSLLAGREYPTTREQFQGILTTCKKEIIPTAVALLDTVDAALRAYQALSRRIAKNDQLSWIEPVEDIRSQLQCLFSPGFISRAGLKWIKRYPVYIQAIEQRLNAVDQHPEKDRHKRSELTPLWRRWVECQARVSAYDPEVHALQWAFEELRVSLFAQRLGVIEKVSLQRLEKRLNALPEEN